MQKQPIIYDNETVEDLQVGGMRIIQPTNGYRFTTDAVLLANCVRNVKGKRIVELGSGSGVISILIAYKCHPKHIWQVEIQPQVADMARRTVQMNGLEEVISVLNADMVCCEKTLGRDFDVVVCNPPYRKVGSGETQMDESLLLSRHEVKVTLKQVIETAAKLLKNKGEFFLVHQTERLAEAISSCTEYKLQPKTLTLIRSHSCDKPNLFILKSVKNGGIGLTFTDDIVIFDDNNQYTQTVKKLYGEVTD